MCRLRLALWLPALTAALAIAVPVVWSQPPTPTPVKPSIGTDDKSAEVPPAATPEEAAARELDAKLIELGKPGQDGSQIMSNLTYLSDVIGPRLTGSPN